MAFRKHTPDPAPKDPLTPWEAYQARQAKQQQKTPRHPLTLPGVGALRRRKRLINLALILTPLVILAAFFGYMVSPLAKVATISVKGTEIVANQSVIDASKLSDADTVIDLALHQKKVKNRIKKALPAVKSASVSIRHFNQVQLTVTEYPPIGYVIQSKRYHVLLASGTLMKESTQTPENNYPVFQGFTHKEAVRVAKVVAKFPPAVSKAVSEVDATRGAANPNQITMTMADGNQVVADSRTISEKIKYYPSMVAAAKGRKGVFDLEVGAFFKPYPTSSKN